MLSPPLRHAMTLTFDLWPQNLIMSSVNLLKQFRRHRNNNISHLLSMLSQLPNLAVQRPRSTRSSSVVTLDRPPSFSCLKVTIRSFRYALPCVWNQLPLSLRKPHSGTSSSITSSSFNSPLCSSITLSLFHSWLKIYLFHKILPSVVSLLPPGLPFTDFCPDHFLGATRCWF